MLFIFLGYFSPCVQGSLTCRQQLTSHPTEGAHIAWTGSLLWICSSSLLLSIDLFFQRKHLPTLYNSQISTWVYFWMDFKVLTMNFEGLSFFLILCKTLQFWTLLIECRMCNFVKNPLNFISLNVNFVSKSILFYLKIL